MNGLWCKNKMMQDYMTMIMNCLLIHEINLAWTIELYLSHIHVARYFIYIHLLHIAKFICHNSFTEHVERSPLNFFSELVFPFLQLGISVVEESW